jgi:hypothetical protein
LAALKGYESPVTGIGPVTLGMGAAAWRLDKATMIMKYRITKRLITEVINFLVFIG